MSLFSRLSAVACSIMLSLMLVPAVAQEGGPVPPWADFEGLQHAVTRGYALDFSEIEPTAPGTPAADYRDALFFSGLILEFDTSDHAAAGYDVMLDYGMEPLLAGFGMEAAVVTSAELDDLGEQAYAFSAFNDTGQTSGHVRLSVMQKEHYLFLAVIIAEQEASSLDADALLAHFDSAAVESPTGVGEFVPTGAGSTGGLWDFYPAADDALWEGLAPTDDEVLFPEQAA